MNLRVKSGMISIEFVIAIALAVLVAFCLLGTFCQNVSLIAKNTGMQNVLNENSAKTQYASFNRSYTQSQIRVNQ